MKETAPEVLIHKCVSDIQDMLTYSGTTINIIKRRRVHKDPNQLLTTDPYLCYLDLVAYFSGTCHGQG